MNEFNLINSKVLRVTLNNNKVLKVQSINNNLTFDTVISSYQNTILFNATFKDVSINICITNNKINKSLTTAKVDKVISLLKELEKSLSISYE